ncbi:hypothetical protein ILUMI_20894 [Ignelater luminosus]|uniref:Uncharacterized protein n=1 Tax=Ignelater luminosus TaxID=2038154 RepID=A0A8K0G448_IGNLU|nr:hypothetical protein ILUMI_20894 [Ignelater luminosus]
MENKRKLQGTNLYIENYLTVLERNIQRHLREVTKQERENGNSVKVEYKAIVINHREYKWNELITKEALGEEEGTKANGKQGNRNGNKKKRGKHQVIDITKNTVILESDFGREPEVESAKLEANITRTRRQINGLMERENKKTRAGVGVVIVDIKEGKSNKLTVLVEYGPSENEKKEVKDLLWKSIREGRDQPTKPPSRDTQETLTPPTPALLPCQRRLHTSLKKQLGRLHASMEHLHSRFNTGRRAPRPEQTFSSRQTGSIATDTIRLCVSAKIFLYFMPKRQVELDISQPLIIKMADTDVVLLLVATFDRLQTDCLRTTFGTFSHALTGDDATSSFAGYGKESVWEAYESLSEIRKTFQI